MTTYNTTWLMDQASVNTITSAKQFNSFALQVDGTGNYVTWIEHIPGQEIDISLVEHYGAFVTSESDFSDGTVLKAISRYDILLGTCYSWTGTDMVVDKTNTCDANSVMLTNNSGAQATFDLTKLDPATATKQPICADIILVDQPVTYTPILTMYAKVGNHYKTSSIIATIGKWAQFEITELNTTFTYDPNHSQWTM